MSKATLVNGLLGRVAGTGRQERPGPRIKPGKPAARLGKAAGHVVWTLDSTACHQPGKVELRMHMEQDQGQGAEGEGVTVRRGEAAQQQTPEK